MRLIPLVLFTAAVVAAQVPRVAVVDYYGISKVSESRIRKAVGVSEGDPLPASKGDVEDRLEQVPGVVQARLEAVCCEGGRAILYVGIEEKNGQRFDIHMPPGEDVALPEAVFQAYRSFLLAFEHAARAGETRQDLAKGHALSADPATRVIQEQLPDLAEKNLDIIRRVLRNGADEQQRAAAAYIIGYAPKKRLVVDDLQYALQDPAESVRANAMRSLEAIAVLARDPELGVKVEPTWFIEMLNSIVWSDRHRAAAALVQLTESRDPSILRQLQDRGLNSLVEMAQWRTLRHALPGFLLLGRTAGVPEAQIHSAWENGDRAQAVLGFLKTMGVKK